MSVVSADEFIVWEHYHEVGKEGLCPQGLLWKDEKRFSNRFITITDGNNKKRVRAEEIDSDFGKRLINSMYLESKMGSGLIVRAVKFLADDDKEYISILWRRIEGGQIYKISPMIGVISLKD